MGLAREKAGTAVERIEAVGTRVVLEQLVFSLDDRVEGWISDLDNDVDRSNVGKMGESSGFSKIYERSRTDTSRPIVIWL